MSLVKRLIHKRDRTIPRNWTRVEMGWRFDDCPPNLTTSIGPTCNAHHTSGYVCTRIPDHTGRHAAGGFKIIVAVWE